VIAWDTFALGRRQRMRVMEVVWPVTALSLGSLALLLHVRLGRPPRDHVEGRPMPGATALAVGHCGSRSGCSAGNGDRRHWRMGEEEAWS
jgi:hypothetical protein